MKKLIHPDPEWGPALPQFRDKYIATLSPSESQCIQHVVSIDQRIGSNELSVTVEERSKMLQQSLDSAF